ncbi:hypothetical protein QEN19_001451 [Hanseniaspora menglaensis]
MNYIRNGKNPQVKFTSIDSEYTEPSIALLELSRLNNKPLVSKKMIEGRVTQNQNSGILVPAQEIMTNVSNRVDLSLFIGENNKLSSFVNTRNNNYVSTPDLSGVGFSDVKERNKRKFDSTSISNNEVDEAVTTSFSNKQLKTSVNATPTVDDFTVSDEEDYDISKLPRASIEQKLAIVQFFKSYKTEIPRFKLVNMFNKKIAISISSLSSWLKNESSLTEKYFKKNGRSDLSSFNFKKIIQDLVDASIPDFHEQSNGHDRNLEHQSSSSRKGSRQLSGDVAKDIDNIKKGQRSKYYQINKMMDKIVFDRKSQSLPINESVLKEYWIKFFSSCGLTDPKRAKGPSNGWLDNFKNKHELKNYDVSGFEFNFKKVGIDDHKTQTKTPIRNDKLPYEAQLVSLPESSKKDSSKVNNLVSHESALSAQSGLYITKSSKTSSDYDKSINAQSMGISTSGKIDSALNDDIRTENNLVSYSSSNATHIPNNAPNTDFTSSNIKFFSSQQDLTKNQESTDSFFKKFGSGIFNFNNACTKDLENVNAFFQQQKQTQTFQSMAGNIPNGFQNLAVTESEMQTANTPKKVESNILWWFKNNANQQLPISSGLSFFNLSSYNKNQQSTLKSNQTLENYPSDGKSDTIIREQTNFSDVDNSIDNSGVYKNHSQNVLKAQSPSLNSAQENNSQPTLAQSNKLFSGENSTTASQISNRFSKILSSNSFKENISNSIKNLKQSCDDDFDDSDDSDGGLEINVPQNFKQEEVELLMKVHVLKFLKKNQATFPSSFEMYNKLLAVFDKENSARAKNSSKEIRK